MPFDFYFGYITGYVIGALARTAIILGLLAIVIKLTKRQISKRASFIIGSVFFIVISLVPILIPLITTGGIELIDIILAIIFGAVTGCCSYVIAYRINGQAKDKQNDVDIS